MTVSCSQIGGKIFFQDDEWTQMREDARKADDDGPMWNAMLDEWYRKWTVNGLRVYYGYFRASYGLLFRRTVLYPFFF